MVNRVLWGQEQFGGGFCGAGAEAASDVNPLTRKGLRTLGMCSVGKPSAFKCTLLFRIDFG